MIVIVTFIACHNMVTTLRPYRQGLQIYMENYAYNERGV